MKKVPEISVIVPVYNTGMYLRRCIDSILAQTYSDFELILVDDGSIDESPEICDEYERRDRRIRVIHQSNQGQSAARNHALEIMTGQWVHFCDSDDWIHPQMLEKLYIAATENNLDVSICGYAETTGNDPEVQEADFAVTLWHPKEFYINNLINATIPVGKLYHRRSLENVRFPIGKYIDDEYFTYKILFAQQYVAVMKAPLYAYYVNMNSLTKRAWNPRRLDAWDALEEQIAYFEGIKDQDLIRFRYRTFLENAIANLEAAQEFPEKFRKEIRYIKRKIRSLLRRAWKRNSLIFKYDCEVLMEFYPVLTRIYRFLLEKSNN